MVIFIIDYILYVYMLVNKMFWYLIMLCYNHCCIYCMLLLISYITILFSCYFTFISYIFCLAISTFFSFLSLIIFLLHTLTLSPFLLISYLFVTIPFSLPITIFFNNFFLYVPFNFVYIYPYFFSCLLAWYWCWH